MTRSGNRRRRVPFYPANPGTFQPKEQQPQGSALQEDDQMKRTDGLGDRRVNGADRRNNAGNGQSNGQERLHNIRDPQVNDSDVRIDAGDGGSDQRNGHGGWHGNGSAWRSDAADRQSNGSDRKPNAGDPQVTQDYRYTSNGSDGRFEGFDRRPDILKKDANEQKPHVPNSHHQRSQSRDRPINLFQHQHLHHQHQQKHQRWEGKDSSDQNKDPAAKELEKNEGKSSMKPQEYTAYMASRARDLKEEGNRRFQKKDYLGAMDQYELALKLTPPQHPDRAVFHSNRAACLMQMKPVQFDAAIRECNHALEAHPGFARALLRRARAYEAVGKLELALQDVQLLLQADVSHPDALDMAKRIRLSMGYQVDEPQQDLHSRLSTPASLNRARSCVGPSSTVNSKPGIPLSVSRSFCVPYNGDDGSVLTPCPSSRQMQTPSGPSTPCESSQEVRSPICASSQFVLSSWPIQACPSPPLKEMDTKPSERSLPFTPPVDPSKVDSSEKIIHQDNQFDTPVGPLMRPLKLIYDHDIRLAEMPANCKFGELRKLVKGKFPSSKAILLKYRDVEGDLVTITSTEELRLAEAAVALEAARRNLRTASIPAEAGMPQDPRPGSSAVGLPVVPSVLDQLRLHVVEVPAEQEPCDKEDILVVHPQEPTSAAHDAARTETSEVKSIKEKDFDKWLLEFAHLFRTHLGIDPSGHVDFHDLGLELCAEALEETITTEEAHKLFEQAGCKFQDMVALGFFNWGNVFMCAARKEVAQDSDDDEMDFYEKLKASFDWAHAQYALAEEKFLLSLRVKPEFCDGILGLGQKDFESAKLNWSLAVASQTDLRAWDSSKTLKLFCSAGAHTQKAADLLAKQGESRSKDAEAINVQGSADAHDEPKNALKTQVYLFWGNILYEHSQVAFRLGLHVWNELLDAALHKFEVAGASSSNITTAIQKHLSSSSTFLDAREASGDQDNGDSEVDKVEKMDKAAADVHSGDHSNRAIQVERNDIAPDTNGADHSDRSTHIERDGAAAHMLIAEHSNNQMIEPSCEEPLPMDSISELLH